MVIERAVSQRAEVFIPAWRWGKLHGEIAI
jgi:hypothetical protein